MAMMAPVFRLVTALFVALSCAAVVHAESIVTRPFRGVTHTVRTETTPRGLRMHVIEIDLRARGIRFKLTEPGGSRDTVRETTLNFLERQQAQVAINCHFMVPYPSTDTNVDVVGIAASKGTLYSAFEPQPVAPAYVDQSYALLPYAPAFNIGRANHIRIVRYEPGRTSNPRFADRVRIWNAVSGSAQIVTTGVKTIPEYSVGADGLKALNGYSQFNSWYDRLRARTAIGVNSNRTSLVLFIVDETGGSYGMTVGEVADVLINDYHVHDALNLDGGGSTTMALQDPSTGGGYIANTPSDNPLGRSVGSNLAVFARRWSESEAGASSAR